MSYFISLFQNYCLLIYDYEEIDSKLFSVLCHAFILSSFPAMYLQASLLIGVSSVSVCLCLSVCLSLSLLTCTVSLLSLYTSVEVEVVGDNNGDHVL